VKFFFPDSLDTVDPGYDFERERYSSHRVRHRTDVFAHEYLGYAPYDGILLSKALVDGYKGQHRYQIGQRLRLLRNGSHRFYRGESPRLEMMGDCGAYAYFDEPVPPFSIAEVLDFYAACQFDYVLSVDHVIPGFIKPADASRRPVPQEWVDRRELTLQLAEDFFHEWRAYSLDMIPIGTAQGWNPESYVRSAQALERMGYDYVALGGLAALQTPDIMACVEAVSAQTKASTRLHLLGVSRTDCFAKLREWGIASFDSTMPLRQAFMDDKHNYHTAETAYLAIRVPQVAGNNQVARQVRQGVLSASEAFELEEDALSALVQFDSSRASMEDAINAVYTYEQLFNGRDHREQYRRLLGDRPWTSCSCPACTSLGIHVVIFRGKERNKRRGFHNLHVFAQKLRDAFPDVSTPFT
jgi:hypothetical protein